MHPGTIAWIASEDVSVVGAAKLDYLLERSLNPFSTLFSFIYRLRMEGKNQKIQKTLFYLGISPFRWALVPVHKKYFGYLSYIIKHNIAVWDMERMGGIGDSLKKNVDLIVMNSWGILPVSVASAPRLGTINIHPSELPRYKGALPTLWALKNHDDESAVTYFLVNEKGVDGGSILAQHFFPLSEKDDWLSVELKIEDVVRDTLSGDIKAYANGGLIPRKQEGEGSSTGKI